jgi:drug/metabolite transporter (DMT)-like permease
MTLFWGIAIGLGGALAQAWSYLLSRHFVLSSGRGARQLLVMAHVWMALFSLVLLPFVVRPPVAGWGAVVGPLLGSALCYFAGQAAFFWTVKQVPASRVSPLLGLKIVALALFTAVLLRQPLAPGKWLAVVLAGVAALCLSQFGEPLPWRAVLGLGLTLIGYSLSDIFIPPLIVAFDPERGLRAGLSGVVLGYLLCGLVALPWAFTRGLRSWAVWRQALPFAIAWYLGMSCFYAAIALVELLFAVIVQATRGLISLALGRVVYRADMPHLEQRITPRQVWLQAAAALLMAIAVSLYAASSY